MDAGGLARQQLPTIAIVGSGPSGCYTAQFLRKRWARAEITVFEALPAPYGLIRYGVAPDHQGTKAVTRQFDRLFERDAVNFVGNVTVGLDLDFATLAASFDVVVLATGVPDDRTLDISQDPQARVIGAGSLIRALNGFPPATLWMGDHGQQGPVGLHLAVIGNGNVAMDVVRLLARSYEGFDGSDIDDEVLAHVRPTPALTIDLFGRSRADQAKFDLAMLREFCSLPNVAISVDGMTGGDGHPVVEVLKDVSTAAQSAVTAASDGSNITNRRSHASRRTAVTFHFGTVPTGIATRGSTTVLTVRSGDRQEEFPVDTVITAVGFAPPAATYRATPSNDWSGPHVYRVGWLDGSRGAIPQNRRDAKELADRIAVDVASGRITIGKPGFEAVRDSIASQVVDFSDWRRVDAFEFATAPINRARRKVRDVAQMLAIAAGEAVYPEESSPRTPSEMLPTGSQSVLSDASRGEQP